LQGLHISIRYDAATGQQYIIHAFLFHQVY
jgi:hypothetical protein